MNTKSITLPILAGTILLLAVVYTAASLAQSSYAFSWPHLDRSDGKAPIAVSGNNVYVAW